MSLATESPRLQVVADGNFVSVPAAFEGAPEGLAHALKVEIVPVSNVKREAGKKTEQTFGTATVIHRALIDFAAVDVRAVDLYKVERDCELMIEALRNHPDEVRQALDLVCNGQATPEMIESATTALATVGLTEQAFREQGGGWVGVAIVVAACLLAGGCFAHCPPPQPQVPHSEGDGGGHH